MAWIISEETSMKRLTNPSIQIPRGRFFGSIGKTSV
jgi:hypothetical protein